GLQALGVSVPLRADATGAVVSKSNPTLTGFFNTAAFAAPAAGAYGTAGRDSIIGPGQFDLDGTLSKTFRMGEFRSLEVRFAGTNVLNHPNWAGIDTNLSSLTFGDVTGFGAPRQVTFTARYRF
ncbi:MAG: TonB-dependent receptor, partial [Terriglobales bacterium]